MGDYLQVKGVSSNQQKLYSSFDAVSACWQNVNGVTGVGSWNFGSHSSQDKVTIYGSEGEISFSVFDETSISVLGSRLNKEIMIENPENIQLFHGENMKKDLLNNELHPSTGVTALHTSWVMDQISNNSD